MRNLFKKAQECNPGATLKIFHYHNELCFNWVWTEEQTNVCFGFTVTLAQLRRDPILYIIKALTQAKHEMNKFTHY